MSRFAAYAADGTRYVVEEVQTVHRWSNSLSLVPTEWPGERRLRLFDGTPVDRERPGVYTFCTRSGARVELTSDDPAAT